ncbi:NIPSNAP family protein [Flagellimonas pelagia]|uniref:NIPSNAP family containing protein n=1 Tax=Flagellimonas pelagia TaxID=2306998 RepID=A0A3A1NFE7_9FLAO|nr:NIPSNAP family protein [Allomuricauda maritima]RIV43034.1 NIPSNAP family containing protein [Allomuricauda maritima]TXJ92234.1 NIPSNAP family containing protein [Allomuricauda maritima]
MKTFQLLALLVTVALASCGNPNPETTETTETVVNEREFYQLKVYTFSSEDQIATTDNYLQNAFIPAVKKQGIDKVGVFKFRTNEKDTVQRTYVLLPFKSMEEFLALEGKLSEDAEYAAAGSAYLNAPYDNTPYDHIESILMQAFTDMPMMQVPNLDSPRSERIYELRSYESPTEKYYWNKVDMFNAGGEVKLFDRLQFNAVFYGEVLSGPRMPNLMYMTTHADMATRDKNWEAFVDSPEWKALTAMPKYENNVSHADIWFLYPTEYSDY